jgi:hypothetical protein
LQRYLTKQEMIDLGWIDEQGNDLFPWKTPDQGAATAVWGITSPALAQLGGVYLEDCDVAAVDEAMSTGVNEWAVDPVQAERLWNLSAELTGVNAFA